ncbi:hypothetical protein FOCC_FOCC002511, partial [Frankliniella occidentalis]
MINGDLTEQQPGIQPGLQPASRVGSKGNGVILSHFRDDHLHEEDLVMKQSRFYSPKYEETFRRSLEDREAFWSEVAETVSWTKRWEKVVDDSNQPFTKWHVEAGRKDKVALIHASPVTNTTRKVTYGELQDQVSRLAGGLAALGVSKGDRVLIYMPLIPETIIAMLATVRLGAVHSVVFG